MSRITILFRNPPIYISHEYGDSLYNYVEAADPNDRNYKGFPVMAKTSDGLIYRVIKAPNYHSEEGDIQIQTSIDGITWSAAQNIYVDGVKLRTGVPSIGTYGNRVIIAYNVGYTTAAGWKEPGSYQTVHYAYTDDGVNWTYADSVVNGYEDFENKTTGQAAYGRMIVLGTKILQPVYQWNTNTPQYNIIFHESLDGGLTWAVGDTIKTGSTPYNETWVEKVGDNLISISRREVGLANPVHLQQYSTDGGETWNSAGNITGDFNTTNTYPISITNIDDTLYMITGIRYTSPLGFYLALRTMPASDYQTLNWGEERIITRPITEYKTGSPQDWGYPEVIKAGNEIIATYYDQSIFYRPGTDGYKRNRIITINAIGNNRFEAFNTSTQTGTLTFPSTWLNSDLFDLDSMPSGRYMIDLSADENISMSVAGETGVKNVFAEVVLSEGESIVATSADSVTNARLRVKKIKNTGVSMTASGTIEATEKTEIDLAVLSDAGGYENDTLISFPNEGDYYFELSVTAEDAGMVWVEVQDWGNDEIVMYKEFNVEAGVNTLKGLFIDVHIKQDLKVYSDTNLTATINVEQK